MEHFLFDLDGTLLPMDQEVFVKFYMPMLAARFKDRGVPQEKLIGAVWNGVGSMVMNDGSRTNGECFLGLFFKGAFHRAGRCRGRGPGFLWK